MFYFILPLIAAVIPHSDVVKYEKFGNCYHGLATESLGAKEIEVWKASLSVGKRTPVHKHETEEVIVITSGKGLAIINGEEFEFEAPCTLILPANIPHQLINTGDIPTEQLAIMGIGSKIVNGEDKVICLPWRE